MLLETDRLRLRSLTSEDAAFILDLLNQPSFLRFIGDRGVRSLEDAAGYISKAGREVRERGGFGLHLVALRRDEVPVGICGLMRKEWLEDPDLAYAFLPRFWSMGYALEAASAMLDHGRRSWGVGRVVAVVTPDNAASIRLLEKLAFTYERMVRDPATGAELKLLAAEPGGEAWRSGP